MSRPSCDSGNCILRFCRTYELEKLHRPQVWTQPTELAIMGAGNWKLCCGRTVLNWLIEMGFPAGTGTFRLEKGKIQVSSFQIQFPPGLWPASMPLSEFPTENWKLRSAN
eukprot:4625827-Prymnesium_polylepis.1